MVTKVPTLVAMLDGSTVHSFQFSSHSHEYPAKAAQVAACRCRHAQDVEMGVGWLERLVAPGGWDQVPVRHVPDRRQDRQSPEPIRRSQPASAAKTLFFVAQPTV